MSANKLFLVVISVLVIVLCLGYVIKQYRKLNPEPVPAVTIEGMEGFPGGGPVPPGYVPPGVQPQ